MKWVAIGVSAFVVALCVTVSLPVPRLHAQQPGTPRVRRHARARAARGRRRVVPQDD